jgi:hypothetical protein
MFAKTLSRIATFATVCAVLAGVVVIVLCSDMPLHDWTDIIGLTVFISMVSLLGFPIVRDTIRQRGKWGLSHKKAICGQCGTAMPMHFRIPTSWRQAMWGGWTCAECGFELDKWGRPTKEQNKLAKWAVLRAAEKAKKGEYRQQRRKEQIQDGNDQMQQSQSSTFKSYGEKENGFHASDQHHEDESTILRPYSWYVSWGIVAGIILLGFCFAIGGLTGLVRTEL